MPTVSGSYLELCSHTTPNASARIARPPRLTIRRRLIGEAAGIFGPAVSGEASSGVPVVAFVSGIGVQPRQHKVHAPEAKDHHQKAEDLIHGCPVALPPALHPRVDVAAVNQRYAQPPPLLR